MKKQFNNIEQPNRLLTGIMWLALSLSMPQALAVDVLTQHNDQFRSGANTNETQLTPANVNSTRFGKLYSYPVDGSVYAQPLYVSGLSIAGGTHNVLYVVTMEDSVYAFDADINYTYWQTNFCGGNITPVPISDMTSSGTNGNIHGDVGILSTPVIDRTSGTIYLLARTKNTSTGGHIQTLHALDITTGSEKFGGPAIIQQTNEFSSLWQNQRPGLAEANGNIYICWGSHEDGGTYHGFMMAYNDTNLTQTAFFNTTPDTGTNTGVRGAIWMAGQAPAIDFSGNLYVTTANGTYDGVTNWGETCLKLSPTLSVLDWATPADHVALDAGDTDFGAGGCMLLPDTSGYPSTHYVVTGGKEGKIFVLNKDTNSMGHMTSDDSGLHQIWQAIQIVQNKTHHIHGTPVYWNSGSQGKMIYVWGENDYGRSFNFDGTSFNTNASTQTSVTSPPVGNGMPGAFLAISANGNTNGILWANCVDTGDALRNTVPGILRAYDANNLTNELWNSYQNATRDDYGYLAKYCPPTIANGKVYMSTFSSNVCVYGLLITNGTYRIINRNSSLMLDTSNELAGIGTDCVQWSSNSASSQLWAVTALTNNYYKIIGASNGLTLDVFGQQTGNGTAIQIYSYLSQSNQEWVIAPGPTAGYYTIEGLQSLKLMQVLGSATTNGAPVDIFGISLGNNQQWQFVSP